MFFPILIACMLRMCRQTKEIYAFLICIIIQTECTCTNFVSSYGRVYVAIYATLVCIDVYILHVCYIDTPEHSNKYVCDMCNRKGG